MKHIPNLLTLSRVFVFSPLLVIFMLNQQLFAATFTFAIGLATDWLDGFLAHKLDARTELGANILQPVCDLIFAGVGVTMLIVTDYWQIWVGVLLLAIAGILQLIHWLAGAMPNHGFIQTLKKHQTYIHPRYSVAVMIFTATAYLSVTRAEWPLYVALLVTVLFWSCVAFAISIKTRLKY